jgi:hypothetical protein
MFRGTAAADGHNVTFPGDIGKKTEKKLKKY